MKLPENITPPDKIYLPFIQIKNEIYLPSIQIKNGQGRVVCYDYKEYATDIEYRRVDEESQDKILEEFINDTDLTCPFITSEKIKSKYIIIIRTNEKD